MGNHETTDIITYKTYDADMFKKLLGNRDVTNSRVSQIKKSISDVGYVINPIIVNEKMEIIDGQGRVQALKELSLPIYFQIQEGAGIKHCISMNIKMKNWGFMDYVISYKNQKYKDYEILYDAINYYKNISSNIVAAVLAESAADGHNFNQIVYSGDYKIKCLNKGKLILDFFEENITYICDSDSNNRVMLNVLSGLCRAELIDMDRMSDALKNYSGMIKNAYSVKSTLETLQDIYNYKKRSKKFFRDAYYEQIVNV